MTASKRGWIILICICFLLSCMIGLFCFGQHPTVLSVVYDGSYLQKRMAYVWADMLIETVDCIEDLSDVNLTEDAPRDRDAYCIELVLTDALGEGKWRMESVHGKRLTVTAGDYNGFVGASRYFAKVWDQNGSYPAKEQTLTEGSYVDQLTLLERSASYAYNRQGEHRVMFYNALWGEPCPEERVKLNVEMIKQYMPDVLGLQEINKTKRGNQADGRGGMIAGLEALGYVEAVDPRVKNLYATDEKIPGTDASLTTDTTEHVELDGYGTGGGTEVTVNGETFYTFYNCAPLLYNTQTTKLVAAEYYWYKNQWDRRTGQSHSNGATDCASKAATWGVFESIETGERYIAISTHMCTRSDYVRGLQGQEMVDLIARLVAEYDCPVILGGDYNGTYSAANYKCFEENGLVDVERNNLPTVHLSKTRGHHTYPAYHPKKGMVDVAPNDNTGSSTSSSSVDHIMIGNVEEGEMEIAVFGVIIDEMTLSGADHFPMLMDFSIGE